MESQAPRAGTGAGAALEITRVPGSLSTMTFPGEARRPTGYDPMAGAPNRGPEGLPEWARPTVGQARVERPGLGGDPARFLSSSPTAPGHAALPAANAAGGWLPGAPSPNPAGSLAAWAASWSPSGKTRPALTTSPAAQAAGWRHDFLASLAAPAAGWRQESQSSLAAPAASWRQDETNQRTSPAAPAAGWRPNDQTSPAARAAGWRQDDSSTADRDVLSLWSQGQRACALTEAFTKSLAAQHSAGPRNMHLAYASPPKDGSPLARQAGPRSPAARALPFSKTDRSGDPQEAGAPKRKRSTVGEDGFAEAVERSNRGLLTRQKDPVAAAARAGKKLKSANYTVDDVRAACNRVILIMPEDWLIALLHEKQVNYQQLDPQAVLDWFQAEALAKFWTARDLNRFRASFTFLMAELEANDLLPENGDLGQVPLWQITNILRAYQERRRAEFQAKNEAKAAAAAQAQTEKEAAAAKESAVLPAGGGGAVRQGGPAKPPSGKPWTGDWAGEYYRQGLIFAETKLKSPIKAKEIALSRSWDGGRRLPPRPAPSTTIFIVLALERLLTLSTNVVHRHVASAYLFLVYACMRCAQAQDCFISGVVGDEFVEGYVAKEKNPSKLERFGPFWAPLFGITGSRLWLDTLLETLSDVADDCYIFRAFDTESIFTATHLVNGPLRCGNEIAKAMAEILQVACGWSKPEASIYTQHSARHFLCEVAQARGEKGSCRHELGRWCLSVAQLDSLRPYVTRARKHIAAFLAMPDRYSQDSEKLRPMAIIRRQMAAVRKFVAQFSPSIEQTFREMSRYGGWELLDPFVATGGEHEE